MQSAVKNYENPRRLPQAWIEKYLERDKSLLALDVMRAFDQNWKLRSQLSRSKIMVWVLTAAVTASWSVILLLGKFVLEHVK